MMVAKMSAKTKPLREANFPAPEKISSPDFDELCETFKISTLHRTTTKKWLDELVTEFDAWMRGEKLQPDRASDRDRLETALAKMKTAVDRIDKLGPSGRRATRVISASLAPMLAALWIHEKFPDDELTPQRSKLPPAQGSRTSIRTPQRGLEYFIEEKSIGARMEFVERRSVETIVAALNEIIEGLERSRRSLDLQPGSKGGRRPLTYRRYLIINLAEIWRNLGHMISTSANSPFAGFCEAVAVSIGWPADGMSSDIPKAVKDWRNLLGKNRR
jgi:hypothetical protein